MQLNAGRVPRSSRHYAAGDPAGKLRLMDADGVEYAIVVCIAVAWCSAIVAGLSGFYIAWSRLPDPIDIALSMTLLFLLALPKSFTTLLGMSSSTSTDGLLISVAIYWPLLMGLHWAAVKYRSVIALGTLFIIVVFSGYLWFRVGAAMT